ncbi:hypothetical protein M2140_001781 [Clostridiales Family XIII bacterium PM5-7]
MNSFMNSLYNLVTSWQPLVWIIVVIALLAIGVCFIIPSEETKTKGKKALPFVVIGCGLALGAVVIAKEVAGAFIF